MVAKLIHESAATSLAYKERILIEIFIINDYSDGAASSTPSPLAFDAIGPFQFTPPDKFDGKKENFE